MPADEGSSPSSLFRAGYRLGRYELLCPLAEGGMAVVWLARLSGTRGFEKIVAVKLIRPQFGDEERFERMFLDEATIASKIHHPNAVQTLDLGEQDGTLYLVMEWVEGESLARWRRLLRRLDVDVPLPLSLRIVADACAALHAAHELAGEDGRPLGIVHRDVSPQNLLVGFGGAVKVIDFGIAKARNRAAAETTEGVIKGKIPYMAPEQVRGHRLDRGVDVWAAGVCLYELLAGHLPFEGETHGEILQRIASGVPPPPLPASVPSTVKTIVARALDPDPGRRFESASAMQRALEGALVASGAVTTTEDIAAFLQSHLAEHIAERRARIAEGVQAARARLSGASAPDELPTTTSGPPVVTLAASDLQTVDTSSAVSRATSESRLLAERVTTARTRRPRIVLLVAAPIVALTIVAAVISLRATHGEQEQKHGVFPAQPSTPSPHATSPASEPPSPSAAASPLPLASSTSSGALAGKPGGKPLAPMKSASAAPAHTLSPAGKDYGF